MELTSHAEFAYTVGRQRYSGEAVAIGVLQDRARTYREPFTVNLTKIDGTIATISNQL